MNPIVELHGRLLLRGPLRSHYQLAPITSYAQRGVNRPRDDHGDALAPNRVNSILALDSLDGAKVPTISEIKKKVALFKQTLALQKGITNVQITENYTDFIFKFECNFINVNLLQEGLQISYSVFSNDKSNANSNFTWLYLD